jgi:predicted nucleic acid-binding Zn ribbon protein
MEKIGIILKEALKRSGFEKRLMEFQIFLNYDSLVGENIARVSRPVFFRNEVLFIGVESPIWSHQLHFLKRDIIEKLNSSLRQPLIKDIKFQICSIDRQDSACSKGPERNTTARVPDKKIKMIYNISSEIQDPELRKKFIELMIKDQEYRMKKEEIKCSST